MRSTVTTEPTLEAYRQQCRNRVERALERWLPEATIPPERLHRAMRQVLREAIRAPTERASGLRDRVWVSGAGG